MAANNLAHFTYDANGNMKTDGGKAISNIEYNHLNLPKRVTWSNGNWVEWAYDANGTKLKKTTSAGAVKHYINGIEYNGSTIEAVYHAEGRASLQSGTYRYEYTLRDHLGNSRVMFADLNGNNEVTEAEILQQNHYYPFGMNMEGSWAGGTNRYQYNGKELNTDFGLDWMDYGARWYDASMGRWGQVDPLAEPQASYSPYHYTFNNPMYYVDPTGMYPEEQAPVGADGLTTAQWVESARPNSPKGLAAQYKKDNKAKELAIMRYSQFMNDQVNEFLKHGGDEICRELCDNRIMIYYGGTMTINSESIMLAAGLYSEAYTRSIGVSGSLGGGIGLEIGYAKDNYSRGGWFFRFTGQLGFGGGINLFSRVALSSPKKNIQLSDIAGNDISYNVDIGPLGFNYGGSVDPIRPGGTKAFTEFGDVYKSGGYSVGTLGAFKSFKLKPKLNLGARVEFGKTTFF